jgi:hypothetical protein
MARPILQPMPRRHPLPLPVLPVLLARLDELRLAGADGARLARELARDAHLAREVEALRALDAPRGTRGPGARELCDLALAAALLAELRRTGAPHAAGRRASEALLAARLGARIARRAVRPPRLAATELFCLPLLQALAAARIDPSLGGAEAAARDAARLAGAWGFSGAALEVLEDAARPAREGCDEACLLELAGRLAESAGAPRGELGQAALERCARALGLRPAELTELGDFAASARATAAA